MADVVELARKQYLAALRGTSVVPAADAFETLAVVASLDRLTVEVGQCYMMVEGAPALITEEVVAGVFECHGGDLYAASGEHIGSAFDEPTERKSVPEFRLLYDFAKKPKFVSVPFTRVVAAD